MRLLTKIRRALFGYTEREKMLAEIIARCENSTDASYSPKYNVTREYTTFDKEVFCSGKPVLTLNFNPLNYLPFASAKQLHDSSINQKEIKAMATVYDKNQRVHTAINFVICVDEGNTQLLTQCKVYANLGSAAGQADNLFVIDDRGLKQNFSRDRFAPYLSEKEQWAICDREYVNANQGKLYKVSKTRGGTGKEASAGQIYVHDETGSWMIYGRANFDLVRPTYSTQYLMAKMKAKLQPGNYDDTVESARTTSTAKLANILGTVSHRYSSTAGACGNLPKTSIHFLPAEAEAEESKIKYVQVTFKPGERTYTYKWKGEVAVGDEAVVRVENDNYPDLCGTKIVDVVAVLDHNPTRFNLKYLVDVVNMDRYRARQEAEAKIAEAEAALQNRIDAIQREEMMRILSERDPVAALLLKEISELKKII